jgi:hypothetical protein
MEIRILYGNGCPNWRSVSRRTRRALSDLGAQRVPVRAELVDVARDVTAWAGSPTLLIDGRDPFAPDEGAGQDPVPGPDACRLYLTARGLRGAPDLEQLREAIRRALTRPPSEGAEAA